MLQNRILLKNIKLKNKNTIENCLYVFFFDKKRMIFQNTIDNADVVAPTLRKHTIKNRAHLYTNKLSLIQPGQKQKKKK